jgi:DNA repair exonuclease SbcCD ATPase subunit
LEVTPAYVKSLIERIKSARYFVDKVAERMKEGYYDKVLGELNKDIEKLRDKIGRLSKFELLYERALDVMKTDECPICDSFINKAEVEEKLKMVRYKLGNLRDELAKLIMKRNNIYAELNEYKRRMEELGKLLEEYGKIKREHPEILEEELEG